MIDFLVRAWRLHKKEQAVKREKKFKADLARIFNSWYVYGHEYKKGMPVLPGTALYGFNPRGGNAWMCPDCNSIHHPVESSMFSGLQYPSCCAYPQGHRLWEFK